MTAMKILDPINLPEKDAEIDNYGDNKLAVLLRYYSNTKSDTGSVNRGSTFYSAI